VYQPISKCPVCKNELNVTRLQCPRCETVIEGQFSLANNPFSPLTPEQLQFVVTFVRCEGRLNRMEEEMNLSYPTLRSRLNDVVRALGFEPGKEESVYRPSPEERRQILEDLDQGKIDSAEAQRRLAGAPPEAATEGPVVEEPTREEPLAREPALKEEKPERPSRKGSAKKMK
jgi:hypothetical protein